MLFNCRRSSSFDFISQWNAGRTGFFFTINRNDIADQTISFSSPGVVFNRAEFDYVNSIGTGTAINLYEVVDNINFNVAPTAATVQIAGRVKTASGRGIRNVMITMIDSQGNVRLTQSTAFGYYRFDDVAAGETVTLTAKAKQYRFDQSTIVRTTNESIADADFVSEK